MTTGQQFRDILYTSALRRVPTGQAIAEVALEDRSVLIYGWQPRGLRGVWKDPTCIQAVTNDAAVKAIVIAPQPGVMPGQELFTLPLGGGDLQAIADDALDRIASYLAMSTS